MCDNQVTGNQFAASPEVKAHAISGDGQPTTDVRILRDVLRIVEVDEIEVRHLRIGSECSQQQPQADPEPRIETPGLTARRFTGLFWRLSLGPSSASPSQSIAQSGKLCLVFFAVLTRENPPLHLLRHNVRRPVCALQQCRRFRIVDSPIPLPDRN